MVAYQLVATLVRDAGTAVMLLAMTLDVTIA